MEVLSDRIKEFISESGSGSGCGSGCGYGSGGGYGYGYGDGYGDGDGDGCGIGCGSGCGYGSGGGYGYGDGYGSGYGYGYGDGDGDGCGIKTFKNQPVHYIDEIATVIRSAFKNAARGYVINSDLTTKDCVIVKSGNLFAHGDTFAEAAAALQEKLFDEMDPDKKIEMFREKFEDGVKYPAREFWEWHHRLTGSCEFGRNTFAKDREIDLDAGMYTVCEFIEITKDAYGGEVVGRLKEYYTK